MQRQELEFVRLTGPGVVGKVLKGSVQRMLKPLYKRIFTGLGILSVDILVFKESDDETSVDGKVHPHDHEPGEMEIILCFMKNGAVIINVVGDGYKHVYPDGIKLAIAVKCTARTVEMAFGTIRNTPISGNNTD